MALINLGALTQDVRGSLNGSVFSRNKGGAYVRTKVSPVQPRTPAQLAQRAIFSTNAKAWSGLLTPAQRAEWTAFALAFPLTNVFGNAITISGLAAYGQLNNVLGTIGISAELDPPADKSVVPLAAVTGLTNDATAGTLELTTDAQASLVGTKYYVFATSNLAAGITPGQSKFRFIGAFAALAAAVIVDISAAWGAKFGTPQVGQQIWVIVAQVNVATGATTVGQKFSGIGA